MKETKISLVREILESGDTLSQLEAYKITRSDGRPAPVTRLSAVIKDLRERYGLDIETMTWEDANKWLCVHRYDKSDADNYAVYRLRGVSNGK